jgi:endo-1,4-beta-xylanase
MKSVILKTFFAALLFSSFACKIDEGGTTNPVTKPEDAILRKRATFPIGISSHASVFNKDEASTKIAKNEYNSFTLRFYNVSIYRNSTPTNWGTLYFDNPDKNIQFAKENSAFQRFHGHCLVYHIAISKEQTEYIKNASIADFEAQYKNQIEIILNRYKEKGFTTRSYDVINEVISGSSTETYANTIFRQKYPSDEAFYEFVKKCFIWARNADPEAKLFYNDYGTEFNLTKKNRVIAIVEKLKSERTTVNGVSRGIIDGLGFQSHSDVNRFNAADYADALRSSAVTGLLIHISELDVAVNQNDLTKEANPYTDARKKLQADIYRKIPEIYMATIPVAQRFGITFWDLNDGDSWLPSQRPKSGWDAGTMFTADNCTKKPAYFGFSSGIAGYTITE